MPFNRLGGTSFVMDDGDPAFIRASHASAGPPTYINRESGEAGGDPTIPANELVRIRTRTGHQILLHNSEDLIYIANSRGTAWIELTSNGKIDIYAADSVSIHSEGDINLKADNDVNIEAGANINLKAGADGRISTGGNLHLNSDPASPVSREPGHEPWDGHESNFGGQCNLPDTFRQRGSTGGNSSNSTTADNTQTTVDSVQPAATPDPAADAELDDSARNRGLSDSALQQYYGPQ